MRSLIIVACLICFAVEARSQAIVVESSTLKPFVGRQGLDTMTKQQFLNYGIVQLSDNRFTVSSFTIHFYHCDSKLRDGKFYQVNNNSYKTVEVMGLFEKAHNCINVIIDGVMFRNFKNELLELKGGIMITLID